MTDKDKEELRKEFNAKESSWKDENEAFDWFLSKIEDREKLLVASGHEFSKALELEKETNKLLREKIEAADKVIELANVNGTVQYYAALEHYKSLDKVR